MEILTKNLVTFRRWDGVKGENFEYYGGSLKNSIFRGGLMKNQYMGGGCLTEGGGAWTVCRFKGGLGEKEGGSVFEGGIDTLMHTMHYDSVFIELL